MGGLHYRLPAIEERCHGRSSYHYPSWGRIDLPQPPVLVFANACDSAYMDDGEQSTVQAFAHSLAGAFIRAGVNLYVGNLVRVSDAGARPFARHFYDGFFGKGLAIGEALKLARRQLMVKNDLKDPTWANYVLYGSPTFRF